MNSNGKLGSNPYSQELTDILQRIRAEAGQPSFRVIAKRGMVSTATAWRVFSGTSVPSWDVLEAVLRTLGTSARDRDRCKAAWLSARHGAEAMKQERRPGVSEQTDLPQIVVHQGSVHIADDSATAGKEILVYGGDVHLGAKAAHAAARIVVHGGTVHLAGDVDMQARSECPKCGAWVVNHAQHDAWHNASDAQTPTHLRRVQ